MDSFTILQEESPELVAKGKKKSIEEEQEEQEKDEEQNYDNLFYGNFLFLLFSYDFS